METTAEIPQLDQRVVKKSDGTTYQIDTSNIGSRSPHQEKTEPGEITVPASSSEPASTNPETLGPVETRSPDNGHKPEPTAQEFECPRCGQEKIVGVNGSRRWCLACDAEWPTAQAFLTEVNARRDRQPGEGPTRMELQSRFASILVRLEDEQLGELAAWLDELERRLAEPEGQPALLFEPMVPINQLEEA
jgi:predicted RNA-binding Zn-ribbon protein involved in translation (DUF1610 family)